MSGWELLGRSRLALAVGAAMLGAGCHAGPISPPAPQSGALAPRIIPAPASLTLGGGAPFELTHASQITVVGANAEVGAIAQGLAALIRRPTGFPVPVTAASTSGAS